MKDLLKECIDKTGYDQITVEKIINCFLESIEIRLSEESEVDLGDNIGILLIDDRVWNSSNYMKEKKYYGQSCDNDKWRQGLVMKISLIKKNISICQDRLLETLCLRIGGMYLSDLRIASNLFLVQRALYKIKPESYSLHEWNDAVRYITGENICFEKQAEAAGYLMNYSRMKDNK